MNNFMSFLFSDTNGIMIGKLIAVVVFVLCGKYETSNY